MDRSPATNAPGSADTLSQPEAHFVSTFKRVTAIESACACIKPETELAYTACKKSSIDSTLMPPPETPQKARSRQDPDSSSIATIHRFPSRPKSRNNSAESEDSMTSGETTLSAADEARTLGPDDESRVSRCACCRARCDVENLPCLWEKVEGATKDVRLRGQ